MEKFTVLSPIGSPSAPLRYLDISTISRKKSLQIWVKAITPASIVEREISDCNFGFQSTGKFDNVITNHVLLFTNVGSVGFSCQYIAVNSAAGK